jgi:GLPGLI family protein
MKKSLLTSTILLFALTVVKAQKPDTAKAIIHYKFSHLRDTTNRDKPYTENMLLFAGQTSSAYKSYDRKMQDALMMKQLAEQAAEQKGSGQMNFKITNRVATTQTEYYQFPLEKKFIRKERLITPYLIEEPMPVISWKISKDTASFGTLHCQKATAHFKGRDYTAWFCPDLPFHSGPWKLNGLPGLIVEAYDTNKEVVFKFDGLENVVLGQKAAPAADAGNHTGMMIKMIGMDDANEDPNVISVPTDAVRTTEKEFNNLKEAMRKDPNAFSQSASAAAGANMRPMGASGAPVTNMRIISNESGPVINNPLELPEKK